MKNDLFPKFFQQLPEQEGIADYGLVFRELKKLNKPITGVLMPFYCEKDFDAVLTLFREEIAYFKRCQQEAGMA